uniref:Rho-GAP domain-containing protein n=1 Tax=Plectus sambesii TaxID=2011161 RepID=A0A914XHB7_9BILA
MAAIGVTIVLSLVIRNTGKYPVYFKFGKHAQEEGEFGVSKRWLTVTPSAQRIDVGQEAVIDLQVLIDKESAWALNSESKPLNNLLVLHLRNGRDYFLVVSAEYVPSCYGKSLEELMQSSTLQVQLIDLGPPSNVPDNLPVPKELWRMVEHIRTTGLDEPDLFSQPGAQNDFIAIREALDAGFPEQLPCPDRGVHSVCEALLRFLDSLPESVIPLAFQDRCLRVSQSPVACWQIVDQMPVIHSETFHYLIQFLREVLQHSVRNGTTELTLCETFAGLFFRMDGEKKSSSDVVDKHRAIGFVQSCLAYDKETALRSKLFENRVPNMF